VYPEVPAELVVEILSPSNRRAEMDAKVNEYLAAGVRVVWVVDPLAYTVTVYHEPDAGELLDATAIIRDDVVLPGFSCRVGEFFE
jgi:Uma2 family endonuclease